MNLNVIGLLNIAIEDDEFVINDKMKLISRDYFEKNNIVMPREIRFYKTFIVSEGTFQSDFSFNQLDEESQKSMPLYLLLAFRLYMSSHDVISSEWFTGNSYEGLKEFVKINQFETSVNPFDTTSKDWVENFIINKIANLVDNDMLQDVMKIYTYILNIYTNQAQGKNDINLHWLIAFTRFQEYYFQVDFAPFVRFIQSSIETMLVSTDEETAFRAKYYASMLAYDTYEDRISAFKDLTWIYNIEDFEKELRMISDSQLEIKVRHLKEIISRVLVRTIGLSTREIKHKLQHSIFNAPNFIDSPINL